MHLIQISHSHAVACDVLNYYSSWLDNISHRQPCYVFQCSKCLKNLHMLSFQHIFTNNWIYLRWILMLLIQHKEVEIWALCQRQLSVLCAQLLLRRSPVFVNTLIKCTKIYVIVIYVKKNYTSKQSLDIHVQSVHEKLKHNCDFCNWSFQLKRSLINQLRAKHSPIIISSENGSSVQ